MRPALRLAVLAAALTGAPMSFQGCTSLGITPPNLANDCQLQATTLENGKGEMRKLLTAERASIDAQIAQTQVYCRGDLPADQTAASKAVEASTAQISATLALAALRK